MKLTPVLAIAAAAALTLGGAAQASVHSALAKPLARPTFRTQTQADLVALAQSYTRMAANDAAVKSKARKAPRPEIVRDPFEALQNPAVYYSRGDFRSPVGRGL